MVSGHPLSTGFIQVTLTSQPTVSVSLFLIVGGNGVSVSVSSKKSYFIVGKIIPKSGSLRPIPIGNHATERVVQDIL